MELELKRNESTGYDMLLETTLFSEETLECIVPDFCPDILRIVSCDGTVCLKSREAEEGRAELRGMIYACVLYLPEDGKELRHMEVSVPFLCSTEHPAIGKGVAIHAVPRLLGADARLLNPRKIYVRAELAVDLQVYSPSPRIISTGFAGEARWGVEEKRECVRRHIMNSVQEKSFTYSDEVVLPASKPDLEELLHYRVEPLCTEYKVIGSKLILKGQVMLKLLYRGKDCTLSAAEFEFPFSQIMELSQVCEEADCELSLFFSDAVCQPAGEDPRKLSVMLGVTAQAVLRQEQTEEILTDLYSTLYSVELEKSSEAFEGLCEQGSRRISVRDVLEVPVAVKSVSECWLNLGNVLRKQEGNTVILQADIRVNVLYTGEDDGVYALMRSVTAQCPVNAEHADSCSCSCQCPGELYATPTAGGIELRFSLDFSYRMERELKINQISGARLDETQPRDTTHLPSIVLRLAEDGETLWELAKTYFTTKNDIMAANELSEEADLTGRLLLIPKKR